MLCKVTDEKTKAVEVALGDDVDYYAAEGFTDQEVEEGYNGFYLKGYAPEMPDEIRKKNEIDALKTFLNSTDWIVVEIMEKKLLSDEKGADDDLKKYAATFAQRATARKNLEALEKVAEK